MIEKRPFGRTGHWSTRILFGAAALSDVSQRDADHTLDLLQSYGVNHIDVAASYGDAELRVGPWMENHRQDFFLATKTEERTYKGAWAELQRSHPPPYRSPAPSVVRPQTPAARRHTAPFPQIPIVSTSSSSLRLDASDHQCSTDHPLGHNPIKKHVRISFRES